MKNKRRLVNACELSRVDHQCKWLRVGSIKMARKNCKMCRKYWNSGAYFTYGDGVEILVGP